MQLTEQQALDFSNMPLTFLRQEYPNYIMHLLNSEDDLHTPAQLHPIFYGCFDWHSAVHGYWLLLHCLAKYPQLPNREAIITLFDEHFTSEKVAQELAYFQAPFRTSFERPYGWAWLLALSKALKQADPTVLPKASQWFETLQPLTLYIRESFINYLKNLTYPIRVGTHFNTAFSLVLALDYAHNDDATFEQHIREAGLRFYMQDKRYPAHYEPAGDDYLSGALTEALFMSKLLGEAFGDWLKDFIELATLKHLSSPAQVSDRTDPKIAHLDGLNLSRVWCFKEIARALPAEHPYLSTLENAQASHLQASLDHVVGSHYSGAHWLATFAALALS